MELLTSLHFLRPWWFLALLPIAWLIWRAWNIHRKQGAWHEVIAPQFRQLLLGDNASSEPTTNEKLGYIGLAMAWFLTVLALSGPWVKSVDIPAQKSHQGIVIVLDLSLSMLADDVSPNRLARVKYKLTDLLNQHPEYATGMVAYAGSAHTISPISEDNQTLLSLLPSLNPVLMPSYGARPLLGLKQADQLLKGAKINHGHIIWITDDLEQNEVASVSNWIDTHAYSVTLMTVGTEKGGVVQIPNYGLLKDSHDKLIMPKVPIQRFRQLTSQTHLKWVPLKTGEDSVNALLPPDIAATKNIDQAANKPQEIHHPLDIGAYFLFLLIPLVAFIFRRGTLLSILVVVLIPVTFATPQSSYAADKPVDMAQFTNVFKSNDQQGYEAWKAKNYGAAQALFENTQWRASALYRQGKYAEAAQLFKQDKSAQGQFNYGNALAKSGDLNGAKMAYEKALKLKPNNPDIQANLAIINKALKQKSSRAKKHSQPNNKTDSNAKKSSQSSHRDKGSSSTNHQKTNPQKADKNTASQSAKKTKQQGDKNNNATTQNKDKPETSATSSKQTEKNQNQKASGQNIQTSQSKDSKSSQQARDMNHPKMMNTDSTQKAKLSEKEQAKQNWLKQIPDQPGLFLKRKFEYQFQQKPPSDETNKKQW